MGSHLRILKIEYVTLKSCDLPLVRVLNMKKVFGRECFSFNGRHATGFRISQDPNIPYS